MNLIAIALCIALISLRTQSNTSPLASLTLPMAQLIKFMIFSALLAIHGGDFQELARLIPLIANHQRLGLFCILPVFTLAVNSLLSPFLALFSWGCCFAVLSLLLLVSVREYHLNRIS